MIRDLGRRATARRELRRAVQNYETHPAALRPGSRQSVGSRMDTRRRLVGMAAAQLNANRRRGISPLNGLPYDFVCPSTAHYPFQWFWDSCFHAIALSHIDVGLAEMELRCLLQGQRTDGFIPHMLLWERDAYRDATAGYNLPEPQSWTSDAIQPPLLATALRTVWEAGRSKALLYQLLPRARRYYDWLRQNRDPDGDGLISILQPDESGLDAAPKYDALLGRHEPSAAGLRRAMDALFATYRPVRGDETADGIADASRELVLRHGFREYYHPDTGERDG